MRVAVNDTVLNVARWGECRTQGERPTLVFLHHFGGSSRTWFEVINGLRDEFHSVVPDLRGFGLSGAPAAGYTVSDSADDVAALIDQLGVDRYTLIGHSMGGKIALALAARRPAGLESLVLVAPSPPSPEPIPNAKRARLLKGHGDHAAAEQTVHGITTRRLAGAVFRQTVADVERSSAPAWHAWLEHGSREDLTGEMPRVAVYWCSRHHPGCQILLEVRLDAKW